jgi:hypothetical protein
LLGFIHPNPDFSMGYGRIQIEFLLLGLSSLGLLRAVGFDAPIGPNGRFSDFCKGIARF